MHYYDLAVEMVSCYPICRATQPPSVFMPTAIHRVKAFKFLASEESQGVPGAETLLLLLWHSLVEEFLISSIFFDVPRGCTQMG